MSMSRRIYFVIKCDAEGCALQIESVTSFAATRRIAEANGWLIRDSGATDLCPEHRS